MGRLIYTETLETTQCWCGIHLAVPDNLLKYAYNGGQSIYCPLGHQFSWKETEADRLRRQLERAERISERRRVDLEHTTASLRVTKGHVTRLKNRDS